MTASGNYGSDICYGTCLIDWSLDTLAIWEDGMTAVELYEKVQKVAVRSDITASSQKHYICELFKHRFLSEEGLAFARLLNRFQDGLSRPLKEQILFLLVARADDMIRDFMELEYWPRVKQGHKIIDPAVAKAFIEESARISRGGTVWSDRRKKNLSGGIMGMLSGFGFIDKKGPPRYRVTPLVPLPELTAMMACELHERGLSDDAVVDHRDWKILGLDRNEVIGALRSSRFSNLFIVQSAGDFVNIAWKLPSLMSVGETYVLR